MARGKSKKPIPKAVALPPPPDHKRRGAIEIAIGVVIVLAGFAITALSFDTPTAEGGELVLAYGPVLVGFALIAKGALDVSGPIETALQRRSDPRRWIYGGLALGLAVFEAYAAVEVLPNRLPGAAMHLWTFPILTFGMAAATLSGLRGGWWVAVLCGGALLLSVMLVIVRILVSAAFLAGVYGAFGKAAATFSLVAIVLIAQVVAMIPIFHIRWLMSRRGKRAFGV